MAVYNWAAQRAPESAGGPGKIITAIIAPGQIIFWVGFGVALIGQLWLAGLAFNQGRWWGIGSLLLPFFGFVFALIYWPQRVKIPTILAIIGLMLAMSGALWLTVES